jgi:quercetin dioxygenase-like cupin family protein
MLAPTTDHGVWFLTGRIQFHLSQDDNADGISVVEHHCPQGFGPPLHIHHDEDEVFHVIEGELRIRCGDRMLAGLPGDVHCLPRGVPHGFTVVSDGARFLTVTRGGFEAMLRAASRPAEHGGLPDNTAPTLLEQEALARVCAEHGIDLIGPPIA